MRSALALILALAACKDPAPAPAATPAPAADPAPTLEPANKPDPKAIARRNASPSRLVRMSGSSGDSDVQKVIGANARKIRQCFQRALARRPGLSGKVVAGLEIAPDGRLESASVAETTLGAPEVERCIVAEIKKLRFPPAEGKRTVQFPFVFATQ